MRIASIDSVEPIGGPDELPLNVRQKTSVFTALLLVGGSLAGICAVLAPVALIAIDMLEHPGALNQMGERPVSTALLTTGIAIALLLLTYPLRAGVAGFARRRQLQVTAKGVKIDDTGMTGTRRWAIPMAHFCGVTYHIRATLSGARHEIILVHRDPAGDILLQISNRPPEKGADHFARLLGLPELPAKAFYGRRRELPEAAPAEVGVQSAAA